MSGMASETQLKKLKSSIATDFDRLFLQLMIAHHDGALEMVDDLKKYPGSAYDPLLNEFVSDLVNDQAIEIERMNSIAVNLSDDPRAGLYPGIYTADEAIMNLELVSSLKKPKGFYNIEDLANKGILDSNKSPATSVYLIAMLSSKMSAHFLIDALLSRVAMMIHAHMR